MNQKAQAKRQFPYVTLILLVSLALVVLILGYSFVESIGLIGRFNNEARSDNFKLNKNHINVYYSHEFQNAYQNYYYQYLMASYGQGTNTSFIKQFSSPAMAKKMKRMGRYEGRRASWKKAIVKLTADSKTIEFFEGMA